MMVLENLTNELIDKINKIVKDFLWKGQRSKVALETLQLTYEQGGLCLFNIRARQDVFKISWIQNT